MKSNYLVGVTSLLLSYVQKNFNESVRHYYLSKGNVSYKTVLTLLQFIF
jgi:hypothetical protein